MRPGSPLWQPRVETLGVSASLEQSRVFLAMVREALQDVEDDYRWMTSGQRLQVTHKATATRLRILSSSGRRAMGLEGFSTIYADEPGAWEVRGGQLMFDALRQSLGKRPDQRLVLIGTRSPSEPGSWWPNLIDGGSGAGTHVTELSAPVDQPWDSWHTIRKVNPLVMANPALRKTILRERDEARRCPDDSMRLAFEAYRLNRQVRAHADVLVTVPAWRRVERRDVPPRVGRPVAGVDLGSNRAWSAAWILWKNGRSECYALCGGVPDLAERERQDSQPRGLYQRLHRDGVLILEDGRRVARPETLIAHLVEHRGILPDTMLCDRFLLDALQDAVRGRWPIMERKTRWSEATEDVAAFRQLVADGPLSIVPECRGLASLALAEAGIKADDQGSTYIQKRRGRRSRDDVAVAGVLAAGALVRALRAPQRAAWRYAGMV